MMNRRSNECAWPGRSGVVDAGPRLPQLPANVPLLSLSEAQRADLAVQLLMDVSPPVLAGTTRRLLALLCRDFVALLPKELAVHILGFCELNTLSVCQRVSRKWYRAVQDNAVWRVMFHRRGWYINHCILEDMYLKNSPSLPTDSPTIDGVFTELDNHAGPASRCAIPPYTMDQPSVSDAALPLSSHVASASFVSDGSLFEGGGVSVVSMNHKDDDQLDYQSNNGDGESTSPHLRPVQDDEGCSLWSNSTPNSPDIPAADTLDLCELDDNGKIVWKDIYRWRLMLEDNWCAGRFTTREIVGHGEAIYCLQFDEDKIVSGSRDHTVKVWDTKSGECRKTLNGHFGSVLCLQFDKDRLLTGSSDSSIIAWSLSSGDQYFRLAAHTDSVLNLRFDNRRIVSCSKDKTIRVWHAVSGQLLLTLSGHKAAVNAVQFCNGLIVSASGDRFIKVWSLDKGGEAIRTLAGHMRGVACIQFDGNIVVSGSSDKTVRIWNVHSGALLNTLSGHCDLVRTVQFDAVKIISGSYDKTLRVWDFKTGDVILHLTNGGHDNKVFKLQFDAARIVSCSQDQKIIIWDFSHGIENNVRLFTK